MKYFKTLFLLMIMMMGLTKAFFLVNSTKIVRNIKTKYSLKHRLQI